MTSLEATDVITVTDSMTSAATDVHASDDDDGDVIIKSKVGSVLLQALFAPPVLFGNVLILLAIRYSRSLRKVTYLFIGHLALADLLFGLMICVRCVFIITSQMDDAYPCLVTNAMVVVSGGASMTGILLLCLDAYLSVRFSVNLTAVFSVKVAWQLVACCWGFWLAFGVLGVVLAQPDAVQSECYLGGGLYRSSYLVTLPLVYYLHFACVLYLQLATIVMTRKRFSQLQTFSVPSANVELENANGNANAIAVLSADVRLSVPSTTGQILVRTAAQKRRLQKLAIMTKILWLVLSIYFVCYFPCMTGLLLFALCAGHCGLTGKDLFYMATLLVVSSLVNVIVYGLKSPQFRLSFRQILGRPLRCGNKVAPLSSAQMMT